MSFFSKLLGKTSHESDAAEGERLFTESQFAYARLAFERADGKAKGQYVARIAACRDAAALQMMEEAEGLAEGGKRDLAISELRNASEIAADSQIATRAQQRADQLLGQRDSLTARKATTLNDDQRWAILVGNWTDSQLEESDRYGEAFRQTLLKMHAGELTEARAELQQLTDKHGESAVYLWLEVGRCASRQQDNEGTKAALQTFLDRVGDEISDARIDAHLVLAELRAASDDIAGGIDTLQHAVDKMPDHPLPLAAMGSFLRRHDFAEEALPVLQAALNLTDPDRPDWAILTEMGLAHRALQQSQKAIAHLEDGARVFSARGVLDWPIALALPLAELHEETGNHIRAADVFRLLSQGTDTAARETYLLGAARNLERSGLVAEANKLKVQANAIIANAIAARVDV